MSAGDAARRNTDKVASTMGEMLLKGYKMLAVSCDICNNVLMQDRQGKNICVSCDNEERIRAAQMDVEASPKRSDHKQIENKLTSSKMIKDNQSSLSEVESILREEIVSSSGHLNSTSDIRVKLQYVSYIHECAETITSLQKINN